VHDRASINARAGRAKYRSGFAVTPLPCALSAKRAEPAGRFFGFYGIARTPAEERDEARGEDPQRVSVGQRHAAGTLEEQTAEILCG